VYCFCTVTNDRDYRHDYIKILIRVMDTNKVQGPETRNLKYDIKAVAYTSFQDYICARMELPFFSNVLTVRNAMDVLVRMWGSV
jgi:hypothetical protein